MLASKLFFYGQGDPKCNIDQGAGRLCNTRWRTTYRFSGKRTNRELGSPARQCAQANPQPLLFNVQLAASHDVEVPCTHPKTSKDALEKASIFLPHMMFCCLCQSYPEIFYRLFCFGKGKVASFWKGVAKTEDEKLKGHPMTLEKDWEDLNIPLFIHGDGVDYANNDNLMVFFIWLLAQQPQHFAEPLAFGLLPKVLWQERDLGSHLEASHWSFQALADGKRPSKGPDGKPLEKGSVFYPLKGQLLHPKGLKGAIWSIIGDHEFFSNTLGLPHWAFTPCTFGKGYKEICLEKQKFSMYTHEECLADPFSHHPLFMLPHVSKGLYSHLIGGILHYCCFYEGPTKRAAKKPQDRLAVLFSQIQIQYSEQECKNRLTNLKLSMICDSKKPWSKSAVLECKGAEARHLLPALIPVTQAAFAETMEDCEDHMLRASTSLEKLVRMWDDLGTFPTTAEYEETLHLAGTFLRSYEWLNQWSLEKCRKSFNIVAKHQSFLHLVWKSRHLNPKLHWCFKGEDFAGQISRLTPSIFMGVSAPRLSCKVAPRYRIPYS